MDAEHRDDGDHQQTAADWHGGQWSALYAYASTGTVLDGLDHEIWECLDHVERGHVADDTDVVEEHDRLLTLLHHIKPGAAMVRAREIGRQRGEAVVYEWQEYLADGLPSDDTMATVRRVLQASSTVIQSPSAVCPAR